MKSVGKFLARTTPSPSSKAPKPSASPLPPPQLGAAQSSAEPPAAAPSAAPSVAAAMPAPSAPPRPRPQAAPLAGAAVGGGGVLNSMQVVLRCAKDVEGKPTTYGLTLERRVESGTNVTSVLIKGLDVGSANEGVLQRGDELIAIGGVRVQGNYEAVIQQLTKYKPADGVDAEIVRKPYVPIAAPLAAAAPRAAADAAAAPPTAAASSVLPDGWMEAKSETGRTYYYNKETGERSWVRPAPATIDLRVLP